MADTKGGVISVRSKSFITLPPGLHGFSKLDEPDNYEGKLSFKENVHYNEQSLERLAIRLEEGVHPLWGEFIKEAEKANEALKKAGKKLLAIDSWTKPDIQEWIDEHLRQPREGSKQELPFITFKNDAEYRDKKSGEMKRKTMRFWDHAGTLLDPVALKLGMGSTVAPVIAPGIFISGLIKSPSPTLKLQGLKVLKLVQWGGNQADTGDLSEDDMAALGEDFDVEDLAGFGKKADAPKAAAKASAHPDFAADLDDEIPF